MQPIAEDAGLHGRIEIQQRRCLFLVLCLDHRDPAAVVERPSEEQDALVEAAAHRLEVTLDGCALLIDRLAGLPVRAVAEHRHESHVFSIRSRMEEHTLTYGAVNTLAYGGVLTLSRLGPGS